MPFQKRPINPNLPRFVMLASPTTLGRYPELVHELFEHFLHGANKRCFGAYEDLVVLKFHAIPPELRPGDHTVIVCLNREAIPAVAEINSLLPAVVVTDLERLPLMEACEGGKSLVFVHPNELSSNATSFGRLFTKLCDLEQARVKIEGRLSDRITA